MMNKVMLIGHASWDAKILNHDDGDRECYIDLATNERGYTTASGKRVCDTVTYHHIVVNNPRLIELAERYIKRGTRLYVEGRIHSHLGYDESEGVSNRYEIWANNITLL